MSQPQPGQTPDATRFRVADETDNPDSDPHLLEEHRTVTLCGTTVPDPQMIGGVTSIDHLPSIENAESGEICIGCVRRAHDEPHTESITRD